MGKPPVVGAMLKKGRPSRASETRTATSTVPVPKRPSMNLAGSRGVNSTETRVGAVRSLVALASGEAVLVLPAALVAVTR